MRSFVAFLATLLLCQAKPSLSSYNARPTSVLTKNGEQYIAGGTDASPGEFPWQLSVQQRNPSWSHSFCATLLSASYALSAAHLVDGIFGGNLRVVAGLHRLSDMTGTQIVNVSSTIMHEEYGVGLASYANDISILVFSTPVTVGGNIQPATLPADNSNSYAGETCAIIGWNSAVGVLQKAYIEVISNSQCQSYLSGVGGANIWDNQICVFDSALDVASCSSDGGSSLNCPDDVTRVAGVASWVV